MESADDTFALLAFAMLLALDQWMQGGQRPTGPPTAVNGKHQRSSVIALVLGMLSTLAAGGDVLHSQTPPMTDHDKAPHHFVRAWGDIVADFNGRVWSYVELRRELETGLPPLTVTDDWSGFVKTERALADRIRVARSRAEQGDIFSPTIGLGFKKALLAGMSVNTRVSVMDENPGDLLVQINDSYPEGKPFATMPPALLAVLPELPDGIQYRFLGSDLILLDTRARVIVDRLPHAFE
jgi:hypothetical protein